MSKKTGRPVGRPTLYSEKLVDEICNRLSNDESLRNICSDPSMPERVTVMRWLTKYPDFVAKYMRARDTQADNVFEDMSNIEQRVLDGELDPNAARVALWSKQWRASKLAPKKYNDKTMIVGGDGGAVKIERTNVLDITALDDDQLDALETALRTTVQQLAGPKTIEGEIDKGDDDADEK